MQSRKKQNLEVERKIKQQKRMYAAVFAAICLAVVIVIGWVVWDTQNRRFIMTFNGERIETGDFLFISMLDGRPLDGFTRYAILDELLSVLTIMDLAERYGDGFTDEEQIANEELGASWRLWVDQETPGALGFIDNRRMGEFLNLHANVVPRLIDRLITDADIDAAFDDEMFREGLESHIAFLIEQGMEVYVKYMAQDTMESHQEAVVYLTADDDFDFDDIASRHCVLGTGLEPISLHEFEELFGVHVDDLQAGLPVGQFSFTFSPEFHGSGYYLIFYVYEHVEPDLELDEIEQEFLEFYVQNLRESIFLERVPGWVEEAEYELNYRVFDTFL